ncbi:MAG: hypothetical protein OXQ94_10830 [Gemmatimonadota bacterium]|nr:hypothetical protein [Gemmatimonadota bacterium]
MRYQLGRQLDPKVVAVLNQVLSEFRKSVFGRAAGHHDDHRVTLFARRQFFARGILRGKSPWNDWLIPVARPTLTHQRPGTRFLIPGGGQQAEGVAGRAWTDNREGTCAALSLPDSSKLEGKTIHDRDEFIKEYAAKGFVSPRWVRRRLRRKKMRLFTCRGGWGGSEAES